MERTVKGIWIPIEIWNDDRLSVIEKGILAEIDSLDGEKHCFASNEHIASFCRCTERTVSSAITHLISLGYLSKVGFDGRNRILKSNIHTAVYDENDSMQDGNEEHVSIETASTQGRKNFYADTKKTAHNSKYNIINNNIENKKEKTEEIYIPEKELDVQESFSKFWKAYPRHTNTSKKEAFNKFCKAIAKTTLENMLDAIENQKKTKQWIDGYIPMATTWLNQERWDDEVVYATDSKQEKKTYQEDETPWKAANWLSIKLSKMYPSLTEVSSDVLQKWAYVFDKMESEEGHPASEILSLMKFALQDSFWHDKISNPWDMKKHYIKILAKATDEGWFK